MLKSKESNIRAFVKFTNTSERKVEILWINFRGVAIQYSQLEPNGSCTVSSRHCWPTCRLQCCLVTFFLQINTFCTHPWIFLCTETGEKLQVNHNNVFLADPWYKFVIKADNGVVSVGRQDANIHFPLKSLRDACLCRIVHLVQTKEDIIHLEIPKTLRADLLYLCEISSRFADISDVRNFNIEEV